MRRRIEGQYLIIFSDKLFYVDFKIFYGRFKPMQYQYSFSAAFVPPESPDDTVVEPETERYSLLKDGRRLLPAFIERRTKNIKCLFCSFFFDITANRFNLARI